MALVGPIVAESAAAAGVARVRRATAVGRLIRVLRHADFVVPTLRARPVRPRVRLEEVARRRRLRRTRGRPVTKKIIHESLSLTYNHYNYDSNVPRRRTRGGHNVRHNRRPAPRRRRRWRQPRRHGSRFDDAHVVRILGARHIVAVYAQRRRRRRRYRGDVERVVERVEERRTRR